jgi:hypothetical protein
LGGAEEAIRAGGVDAEEKLSITEDARSADLEDTGSTPRSDGDDRSRRRRRQSRAKAHQHLRQMADRAPGPDAPAAPHAAAHRAVLGRELDEDENPYLAEELMTGKVGARLDRLADDLVSRCSPR